MEPGFNFHVNNFKIILDLIEVDVVHFILALSSAIKFTEATLEVGRTRGGMGVEVRVLGNT